MKKSKAIDNAIKRSKRNTENAQKSQQPISPKNRKKSAK